MRKNNYILFIFLLLLSNASAFCQHIFGASSNICPGTEYKYRFVRPSAFQKCLITGYEWSVEGGTLLTLKDAAIADVVWNASGTRRVTVNVTFTDNGREACIDDNLQGSMTIISNVAYPPDPATSIASSGTGSNFCPNTEIELDANIDDTDDISYRWMASADGTAHVLVTETVDSNFSSGSGWYDHYNSLGVISNGDPGKIYFKAVTFVTSCPSVTSRNAGFSTVNVYPPPPTISSIVPVNPACPGGDGGATINHSSIQGGTNYFYSFRNTTNSNTYNSSNSTGQNPFVVQDLLPSGEYEIKVESQSAKDNGLTSCFAIDYFSVGSAPALLTPDPTPSVPTCKGGTNGSVEFEYSGRKGDGVNYEIVHGVSTVASGSITEAALNANGDIFTINDLSALSNYSYTISDGCSGNTATGTFDITETSSVTPNLTSSSLASTDPSCLSSGTTGNGQVSVNLASSPNIRGNSFTYTVTDRAATSTTYDSWSTSSTNSSGNSILRNGDYRLHVTSDIGCIDSTDFSLGMPGSLSSSSTFGDVTCSNGNDGTIGYTFSKSSGTINYSYTLSSTAPGFTPVSQSNRTTPSLSFNSLDSGLYTLAVTDYCRDGATVAVTDVQVNKPLPIGLSGVSGSAIACYDGTNGTGSFTINDGTGPFRTVVTDAASATVYDNTNPSRSITIPDLTLGSYDVRVIDDCGVEATGSFSVTSAASSAITTTLTPLYYDNNNDAVVGNAGDYHMRCKSDGTGRIAVTIGGGVPQLSSPYYTVTVDHGGVVEAPTDNGDGTYTFLITGLNDGIVYTVNVEDNNGCMKSYTSSELTAPQPLITETLNLADHLTNVYDYGGDFYVQCKGDENGSFTARYSGGNASYDLRLYKDNVKVDSLIGTSGVEHTFAGLGAGDYEFTIEDQQGCSYSNDPYTFTLNEASASLMVDAIRSLDYGNGLDTKCYGDSTGRIAIEVSGGLVDYTYRYDNGASSGSLSKTASTHTFTGLNALDASDNVLNYQLEVYDALNCRAGLGSGVSEQQQLTFPDSIDLLYQIISTTQPLHEIPCRGNEATIAFTSTGGNYLHDLVYNSTTIGQFNTADDTLDVNFLAGTHSVTVSDVEGCAKTVTYTLREPATHVNINSLTSAYPVCVGNSNGTIDASAAGGIPFASVGESYAYQFHIKEEGTALYEAEQQNGSVATFLRPSDYFLDQNYIVKVTDGYGCIDEAVITMPVNPSPLTVTLDEIISPSCFGGNDGSITVSVANADLIGGTDINYNIIGGHYGQVNQSINATTSTYTFTGLEATDVNGYQPYRIWIEDTNACTDTAYQYLANLSVASYPPITISLLERVRPTCYNGTDGWLTVKLSGGIAPYKISTDGVTFVDVNTADSIFQYSDLRAGDYTFYVRDANYNPSQTICEVSRVFNVPEGRLLELDGVASGTSCHGTDDGSISLEVNLLNGDVGELLETSRLSYEWWHNGLSIGQGNVAELNDLLPGLYTVRAQYDLDSLGTSQSKALMVCATENKFSVVEPDPFLMENLTVYDASCGSSDDGKAIVQVGGGYLEDTISYYRLDGGSWQVMLERNFLVSPLQEGSHRIEVAQSDFRCQSDSMFDISSYQLPLALSSKKDACFGKTDGYVVLESEPTGTIEYAIIGGSFQSSAFLADLAPGKYKFVARRADKTSCLSDTLEVVIAEATELSEECNNELLDVVHLSTGNTTCASSSDGTIELLITGGVSPYEMYVNGDVYTGPQDEVSGLIAGDYQVVVVDALNARDTIDVTVESFEALTVATVTRRESCSGTCDGGIDLLVNGGAGNYQVSWSDGSTGLSRQDVCSGAYTFTLTDNGVCAITDSVVVETFEELSVELLSSVSPTCHGYSDGSLAVKIEGGSGDYQVLWSNGVATTSNEDITSGTYQLLVSDQQLGCQLTANYELQEPVGAKIDAVEANSPRCNGGEDGSITLVITADNSPLIRWSDGQIGYTAFNLISGTYDYEVTSSLGCLSSGTVELEDIQSISSTAQVQVSDCYGDCEGRIDLAITGGVAPYYVEWGNNKRGTTLINLCDGWYPYTIIDANNCRYEEQVELTSPEPIGIEVNKLTHVSCFGQENGDIDLSISGGTAPYQVSWSNGGTDEDVNGLVAGDYSVEVVDANGCGTGATYEITEPLPLSDLGTTVQDPLCHGQASGVIRTAIQGGTRPYIYEWNTGATASEISNIEASAYQLQVRDAQDCERNFSYELTDPPALEIVNLQVVEPLCASYSDGSIRFDVAGGTFPYEMTWADGQTGNALTELKAGSYAVTISDEHGCSLEESFNIQEPSALEIEGVESYYVICEVGSAVVSPKKSWDRYSWIGPSGFESSEEQVEISAEGQYLLTVANGIGCSASQTFSLETTVDALETDFLIISELETFQEVIFVDISLPEPRELTWVIPEDQGIVINESTRFLTSLTFTRPDSYTIGMQAKLEDCASEIFKVIEVVDASQEEVGNGRVSRGANASMTMNAYPNPTSSRLNCVIQTESEEKLHLVLYTLDTGYELFQVTLEGHQDYYREIDVSKLSQGTYELVVQQEEEIITKTILIIK